MTDYGKISSELDAYLKDKVHTHNIIIVSGHATGADALGERYAKEHGLKVELYPADWERYGNAAGPIRNEIMAQKGDAVIVFWDGISPGTRSMIECANKKSLPCKIVNI